MISKKSSSRILKRPSDCKKTGKLVLDLLQRPGCLPELISVQWSDDQYTWDAVQEGRKLEISRLHVLESLRLVERVQIDDPVGGKRRIPYPNEVSTIYWHLSDIGVELCEKCSPAMIMSLKAGCS